VMRAFFEGSGYPRNPPTCTSSHPQFPNSPVTSCELEGKSCGTLFNGCSNVYCGTPGCE